MTNALGPPPSTAPSQSLFSLLYCAACDGFGVRSSGFREINQSRDAIVQDREIEESVTDGIYSFTTELTSLAVSAL